MPDDKPMSERNVRVSNALISHQLKKLGFYVHAIESEYIGDGWFGGYFVALRFDDDAVSCIGDVIRFVYYVPHSREAGSFVFDALGANIDAHIRMPYIYNASWNLSSVPADLQLAAGEGMNKLKNMIAEKQMKISAEKIKL